MSLPLPKVVADVGPGGPLVTSMKGINSLANDMILRKINQIKKYYTPLTTQADINSKNAYAQLVGLQPFLKTAGNENLYNPLTEEQKNYLRENIYKAGGGPVNSGGTNPLNNMPHPQEYSGSGQPHTNKFSGYLKNAFHAILGQSPQNNGPTNAINQPSTGRPGHMTAHGFEGSLTGAPAENYYANTGEDRKAEQEAVDRIDRAQNRNETPLELELTHGQQQQSTQPLTNAEKTGLYKGTVEQGKEEGKYRAEALRDIGKAQLALSNQGAAINNMTKIIKDPVWQNMRKNIPAFQDKQLGLLKVTGTDAEKKLIGKYTSAAESLIASTVAGMGSRHLVREYDLAQRQKINDTDTTQSAEGKLQNAIELHDIAEQKNKIIAKLLKNGVDEADAVEEANKMVDVSAIEKRTEALLEDEITEQDIQATINETGMTREQIIKKLKEQGRKYNG